MKQKIVICLLAFVAFCSFSTLQAQGWDKTFTSYLGDTTFANSVVEAHDGGIVFSGARSNSYNFKRKFSPFVVKTNSYGTVIWQYNPIDLNLIEDSTKILRLRDSSFLFLGSESYHDNTGTDTFEKARLVVVRLDQNGNELWRKRHSTLSFLDATLSLDSTNILISGYTSDKTFYYGSKLLRISINGDSLWSKSYAWRVFYKIEIGGDNMIYASTENRSNNPNTDTIPYYGSIWKLDLNGNAIWEKGFRKNSNRERLRRTKDGKLLSGSSKFDFEGQFIFKKPDGESNIVSEGKSDNDLRFISIYNPYNPKNTKIISFVKSDSIGKFLNLRSFDVNIPINHSVFRDLITMKDGTFVGIGYTEFNSNNYLELSNRRARLVKFTTEGLVYSNILKGKTYIDSIQNCRIDAPEKGFENRLITVEKNNETRYAITDSIGNYEMQVDSGNYIVKGILPNSNWRFCTPSVSKQFSAFGTIDTASFALQAVYNCPQMRVSTTIQFLRRCFDNNYYQIRYTNEGTVAAQNAFITLKLDSLLEYVGASRPLSSRAGQTLRFNLGTVPIGFDDQFSVQVRVKCGDSTRIGQTLCTEARVFPDTMCINAPNWSGANIVVSGRCDRDSVRFIIQNTGAAASSSLRRRIVEDELVFMNGNISIPALTSRTIVVPANGKTWRLNVAQEPNNPANDFPTAVVEGCRTSATQPISTGIVNQFPTDNGSPTIKNICTPIVGAYDPNDKEGLPLGYKASRFIDQNQAIDYRIRFQNTGNDTAFTVVLRDTLSNFLDISSIKVGASSHKYTWTIEGQNVLVFRFDNILLVDSFRNVAASQGFVSFKINQKKDVALGSKINNEADIYFDYNAPIRTNKTLHTVGKDFIVSVLETQSAVPNIKINVFPNPFNDEAVIDIQGLGKITPLSILSHFTLFDAFGRQVRSDKFEGNTYQFKRQDLTTGIYFFRIENDGKLIGTGKFLIK